MSDISTYTNAIRNARYGEEVRGSIADALEAMNTDLTSDTASAAAYAASAEASATSASNTATDLESTLTQLESLETSVESAESARVTAEAARANAATGYVAQCREYAEAAEEATTLYGVSKFNDRYGAVVPMSGDYSADMIGYESGTVASALASINSDLSGKVDTSDVTSYVTSSSGAGTKNEDSFSGATGRCVLSKINTTVFCSLSFGYSTTIPTNTAIFTLPDGFAPSSTISLPAILYRDSTVLPSAIKINSSGEVYLNISNITGVFASGTWLTAS